MEWTWGLGLGVELIDNSLNIDFELIYMFIKCMNQTFIKPHGYLCMCHVEVNSAAFGDLCEW